MPSHVKKKKDPVQPVPPIWQASHSCLVFSTTTSTNFVYPPPPAFTPPSSARPGQAELSILSGRFFFSSWCLSRSTTSVPPLDRSFSAPPFPIGVRFQRCNVQRLPVLGPSCPSHCGAMLCAASLYYVHYTSTTITCCMREINLGPKKEAIIPITRT
jgi:hypothetical protein